MGFLTKKKVIANFRIRRKVSGGALPEIRAPGDHSPGWHLEIMRNRNLLIARNQLFEIFSINPTLEGDDVLADADPDGVDEISQGLKLGFLHDEESEKQLALIESL
eukprot:TRINITY_DN121858_c0_g1_i1.p2 TRINITY_DN121858_c0_g1~~TRINITY_DN121858_c0_g1_i1.p2  ORF type:complete len:106 (-),score=5.48 TRINITY_DN121858_c0_g1_i1:6-323(-)